MSNAVLDGVRVLDLGDFVSGPYCSRVLADLGADVIKVEPPAGDSSRAYGPFPGDIVNREQSGLFLWLNYGKRSISIDRESDAGRAQLEALLAESDVAVLSTDLDGRAELRMDLRALCERHPQLIVVAITPFGLDGRYAAWSGYDINVAAMSGLTSDLQGPGREPLMPAALQVHMLSGLGAAFTTMTALMSGPPGARGQLVDFAQTQFLAIHSAQGLPSRPTRPPASAAGSPLAASLGRRRTQPHYPSQVLRCKDGHVFLYAPQIQQWLRLVEAMGEPEWTKERKFRNRLAMANEYRDETDAYVEPWLRQHTKEELLQIFMQYRVPSGPILDARDLVESRHLGERAFFQQFDHPTAGHVKLPGFQFRMSASPLRAASPAPALGQHNEQRRRWHSERERPPHSGGAHDGAADPADGRDALPLAGCRIVDFGTVMVGGIASRLVAELGAEVIKVESRVSPEGYRIGSPTIGSEAQRADKSLWPELQAGFHSANRGKLGITLNIAKPEGLELLKRLISVSDVVMNNFSPGVLQRRGLDYESLKVIKPEIILVSMPGAGDTGPLRDYATYAWTIEALVGMSSINGYPDGELLGNLPMAWGDVTNGISGALGALAAVQHHRNTGQGQYVESAQLEAFAALMGEPYLDFTMNGRVAGPRGNASAVMAPHDCYPVANGRWVAIAVRTEQEWLDLCSASGNEQWATDARFRDLAARQAHLEPLNELIADWTRARSSEEVVSALQARGVAATPVLRIDDEADDSYFYDRGAFVEAVHPLLGSMLAPGRAARLAGEWPELRPAPMLGEHNDYVFGEILGVPPDERRRLVDAEVIH